RPFLEPRGLSPRPRVRDVEDDDRIEKPRDAREEDPKAQVVGKSLDLPALDRMDRSPVEGIRDEGAQPIPRLQAKEHGVDLSADGQILPEYGLPVPEGAEERHREDQASHAKPEQEMSEAGNEPAQDDGEGIAKALSGGPRASIRAGHDLMSRTRSSNGPEPRAQSHIWKRSPR